VGAGSSETAARYSVRPLLPGPAEALREAVLRLGLPGERLAVLAERGAVEALALRGLSSDQIRVIERLVADGGGEVLSNADGDRALLLMPLITAGALPMQLAAWSENAGEVGAAIGSVLMARGAPPPPLEVGGHRLEFGRRTLVMGILNVTPDSFSGDGVGDDVPAAVARAQALAEAGADVVDIGGESTRPSRTREPVSAEVEMARVLPVIRELAECLTVPISIDTRKAAVAAAALDAGALIVNDVWGLRGDPEMAHVVAAHPGTGVVVMHIDGKHLEQIGGTSAAAPLWAALVARLNQGLGANCGFLNPVLYTKCANGVLRDITVGNNGAYSAGPGWDACTGLGSPDGQRLLHALSGNVGAPAGSRT